MRLGDLAFAAECTAAEGWVSEDAAALQGFYQHDAAGCLLAEQDGQPVGICMATSYGESGFIGELIVRPEGRGQGLGAALLEEAAAYLQRRGAHTVYLDGVLKAVPLYERHDFHKVCRSLRLNGQVDGRLDPEVRPMGVDDLPAVRALDRRAFGAQRGFFLEYRRALYPELGFVLAEAGQIAGYVLGRRGVGGASAGPWVALEEVAEPERLLYAFGRAVGMPFSIGILETNAEALRRVRALGFVERVDSPWRMERGASTTLGANPACLAIGGAAKG